LDALQKVPGRGLLQQQAIGPQPYCFERLGIVDGGAQQHDSRRKLRQAGRFPMAYRIRGAFTNQLMQIEPEFHR
jgi:hypothetical protein